MKVSAEGDVRAYVRLTDPAFADLQRLIAKDPQIVRWAVKKMLLIERNPNAGEPLLGSFVGWRKLTVGDRNWRIVWRVTKDASGSTTITIGEIWAVGARSDDEVYEEMRTRVKSLGESPTTQFLASVVELLGRHVNRPELRPAVEPINDPVPTWLKERLVRTAKLSESEVDAMIGSEAMTRWERFIESGS